VSGWRLLSMSRWKRRGKGGLIVIVPSDAAQAGRKSGSKASFKVARDLLLQAGTDADSLDAKNSQAPSAHAWPMAHRP
jgi:hypothetical protein